MNICLKKLKYKIAFLFFSWFVFVSAMFNIYAYDIQQLNASIRVFIKTGSFEVRSFDENGLPVSKSAKLDEFVSPFYVVHYGLIYSSGLMKDSLHWREDPSFQYWNVPPPELTTEQRVNNFKSAADWLVENSSKYKNKTHFLYDFDWPYSNYPSGGLTAPWWSGLTDGYAIVLLLRAYDYFGTESYYTLAQSLYDSVLTPVESGGSLNYLNGCPWIEEYVDPRFSGEQMSFVLNGMVYATYGIESFENHNSESLSNAPMAEELYSCLNENLSLYDIKGWANYDVIDNPANVKYFNIMYSLLIDLNNRDKLNEEVFQSIKSSWEAGYYFQGFMYIYKGPVSFSYFHYLVSYLIFVAMPIPFLFVYRRLL